MKRSFYYLYLVMAFPLFTSYVEASDSYCIQVASSKHFDTATKNNFLKQSPYRAYIVKRGDFEALRVGNFKDISKAREARSYYDKKDFHPILMKNCREVGILADNGQPALKTKKEIGETSNPAISLQKPSSNITIYETGQKKGNFTDERWFELTNILKMHPPASETYDFIDFNRYLEKLLREDEKTKNTYYETKLAEINSLISQDRYNSDIEFNTDAGARHTKDIDGTLTRDIRLTARLGWTKRLYDGQKHYIYRQNEILTERDAQLRYKRAKEQLALTGATLYDNCIYSQYAVKVYEQFLKSQQHTYEIVHNRVMIGLASPADEIDAKNDLLKMKKQLITQRFLHKRDLYLFKSSINYDSEKSLYFNWWNPPQKVEDNGVSDNATLFFHKNPDLAIADNQSKLKDLGYLMQKGLYKPAVEAYAGIGAGYGRNGIISDATSFNDSNTWNLGIRLNLPIYRRNDIYLNMQKAKLNAIIAKNSRKLAFKTQRNRFSITDDEIDLYGSRYRLLENLYKGLVKKMDIVLSKYFEGKAFYRDYSDALNAASTTALQMASDRLRLQERLLYQHYLVGNTLYHETR